MCVHMYKGMTRVCDTYNAHTAVSNPSSKHNIMYTCSHVHLQSLLPLRGGGGGAKRVYCCHICMWVCTACRWTWVVAIMSRYEIP